MTAERVLARCDELAVLSSYPDLLERVHLSAQHRAANDLIDRWMQVAGLSTWQDTAGNQCGRLEGARPGLPALVLGSHIDTVTDAGKYDGMLGVLLAIEVATRLREGELPFALEVVAFSEEEGTRFGTALLGSRAFAGTWQPEWWTLTDKHGTTLEQAFTEFGLDRKHVRFAARDPRDIIGYLETHIEQGPYLDDAGKSLAVVSAIAGARRFTIAIEGAAGHAGGAPFDRRRDALVGASELVLAVERISRRTAVIGTVGKLHVHPGGVNVIPGRVDLSLDLRAETDEARDAALDEILEAAAEVCERRSLQLSVDEFYRADAVASDPALRRAVTAGIQAAGDPDPMTLWSRAGHDGMAIASLAPIAMLFVRCGGGGISHHPDESVLLTDVATALQAFEAAVRAIADERELPE